MKPAIFLLPLIALAALLSAGCGSDSTEQVPVNPAGSAQAREPAASSDASQLAEKLERLGLQTPKEDLEAIEFSLKDLNGRETSLREFDGRVVFLNFWATWCGPCRAEIPSMEQLYGELRDQGFTILAVNSQEPPEQVSAFVEEAGMSFPVLLDAEGRIGAVYGVRAISTTYIIGPQGAILGRMVGTRDWNSPEIISLVKELLP